MPTKNYEKYLVAERLWLAEAERQQWLDQPEPNNELVKPDVQPGEWVEPPKSPHRKESLNDQIARFDSKYGPPRPIKARPKGIAGTVTQETAGRPSFYPANWPRDYREDMAQPYKGLHGSPLMRRNKRKVRPLSRRSKDRLL